MTQSSDAKKRFDRLVETVINLESKVLELESDIYNMKQENAEIKRRLSDLESSRRVPPF